MYWIPDAQGTNAHILLRDGETPSVPPPQKDLLWQHERFWVAPRAHILSQRGWVGKSSSRIVASDLSSARLTYLWDHKVRDSSSIVTVLYNPAVFIFMHGPSTSKYDFYVWVNVSKNRRFTTSRIICCVPEIRQPCYLAHHAAFRLLRS